LLDRSAEEDHGTHDKARREARSDASPQFGRTREVPVPCGFFTSRRVRGLLREGVGHVSEPPASRGARSPRPSPNLTVRTAKPGLRSSRNAEPTLRE
jgi:hypothetical protein